MILISFSFACSQKLGDVPRAELARIKASKKSN